VTPAYQRLVVHDCLTWACDAHVVAETTRDGRFVFGFLGVSVERRRRSTP
jgi:hypothetical protein